MTPTDQSLLDVIVLSLHDVDDDVECWFGAAVVPVDALRRAAALAEPIVRASTRDFIPTLDCSGVQGFMAEAFDAVGNECRDEDFEGGVLKLCPLPTLGGDTAMEVSFCGKSTDKGRKFLVESFLPVADVLRVADALSAARSPAQLERPNYQPYPHWGKDSDLGSIMGLARVPPTDGTPYDLCVFAAARTFYSRCGGDQRDYLTSIRANNPDLAHRIEAGESTLREIIVGQSRQLDQLPTTPLAPGLGI